MASQETVSNAIAGLFGSTAGILVGLIAAAVLWLGAEYALNVLDVNLPLRQLMLGRTWNGLGLHARFIHAAGVSYVLRFLRLARRNQELSRMAYDRGRARVV